MISFLKPLYPTKFLFGLNLKYFKIKNLEDIDRDLSKPFRGTF